MFKFWSIFVLILLFLLTAGIVADRFNNENYYQSQRQDVLAQTRILATKLEGNVQSNLQILYGLLGLVVNEPNLDQERFAQFAKPILKSRSQIRNVGLAPDMIITMIYPLKGNEAAIGLNTGERPQQKVDVLRAKELEQLTLTGPINLVQGGQGFVGQIPVYIDDLDDPEIRHFWGLVSEVIYAEKLYQASGFKMDDIGLNLALRHTKVPNSEVFFGDNSLVQLDPISVKIILPNTEWELLAIPLKGWQKTSPNAIWLRSFLGLTILLVVIQLIFLARNHSILTHEQERMRALFELSPIGIALNDFDSGDFIELNQALYAPSGYSREEFVKLSYWDITPKEYAEQEAEQLESLKKTGRYGPYQKEYINKQGERYPVLLNGVLIKNHRGKSYIWSIVEDITDRIDKENRLIHAKEAAEAAAKAKSEFLATMSHEIRTPLNGVVGMIDLLLRSELNQQQIRQLTIAKTSAEFLMVVINDILDFSKIEAGRLILEQIDFNLQSLFNDILPPFETQAHQKNLRFDLVMDRLENRYLKGDPNRIRQIVTNLLGNAIKFTESGSIVVFVQVQADLGRWRVAVSVTDTGIGIPASQQAKLFDAFTQVDASTTRKYGGSGLGLAICHKLVSLMGGELEVESQTGVGSCFKFYVMLDAAENNAELQPQHRVQAEVEQGHLQSNQDIQILLVEDNLFNCEVAKMLLEEFNYSVEIAHNGRQAIDYLNSSDRCFSLILMDCQMPEMDGYEASRLIRDGQAGDYYQTVPIIALTANAMEGDKDRCLKAGMSDYLTKPIDGDRLVQMISQWIKSESDA